MFDDGVPLGLETGLETSIDFGVLALPELLHDLLACVLVASSVQVDGLAKVFQDIRHAVFGRGGCDLVLQPSQFVSVIDRSKIPSLPPKHGEFCVL